jgi:hypothetical protein
MNWSVNASGSKSSSGFLLLFLLSCFKLSSQHVAAKFDLVGLIPPDTKIIRPSVEVSLSKRFSAQVTFEKGDYNKTFTQLDNDPRVLVYHTYGWGIMPEVRYYPFVGIKPAPLGFFVGLHYRYRSLTEKYTGEDYFFSKPYGGYSKTYANITTTGKASNFGIDFGYKYNINVVTLELLAGFGAATGQWQTPNEREHINPDVKNDLSGLPNSFRLEVSLGFVLPKVKLDKILTDAPSQETETSDKKEVAQVIIYRKKKFLHRHLSYGLYANDSLVTHVTNGDYHVYLMPPGKVKFKARTEALHSVTLDVEKGKTYYLRCRLIPGIFISQPYLEVVPAQIGKDETASLKR